MDELGLKTLAGVSYVHNPWGVKFASHFKRLKVKLIAKYYVNVNLTKLYSSQAEVTCLREKMLYPSFFPPKLGGILSLSYLDGLEKHLNDVNYVNTVEIYSFLSRQCAELAKKLRIPLITSVWETVPSGYTKLPPYIWNTKFIVRATHLFIALTKRAKSYLKSLSVPEEKIKVIRMGLDPNEFYPRKESNQSQVPRILFISRLIERRGVKDLLRAFSLLCKNGMKAELWICGRGKLELLVREYAKKYPIKYLGFVEYNKLPQVYRCCDLYCLPSHDFRIFGVKIWEEQFGMPLVEAMASGLPIVATNCGAIPEVVGPENIIVPQGSIKELYFALRNLIEDEKKRRQMGMSNRKRALELFDARENCEKLEKEILSLDSK